MLKCSFCGATEDEDFIGEDKYGNICCQTCADAASDEDAGDESGESDDELEDD